MTDDPNIYGQRNAAAALGMTKKSIRTLVRDRGDALGIVQGGKGSRIVFTPAIMDAIRAHRARPDIAVRIAAYAKRKPKAPHGVGTRSAE